jgi:NAD-dependent SIR2 family protein deacetylase
MRTNKHGKVILTRCEVCGEKLTKEEQETRGYNCNACVEDLKETFRRIDARYNISRNEETGELIISEKKPAQ